MTGAGAGRAAACGRAAVRRTAATLVLDLRRQATEGYWFVALLAGLMVGAVLLALAGDPRRWWPVVVLAELSITSFYFAAFHRAKSCGLRLPTLSVSPCSMSIRLLPDSDP